MEGVRELHQEQQDNHRYPPDYSWKCNTTAGTYVPSAADAVGVRDEAQRFVTPTGLSDDQVAVLRQVIQQEVHQHLHPATPAAAVLQQHAPHPPTNPTGLGNQGGFPQVSGMTVINGISPTNSNLLHVPATSNMYQPGQINQHKEQEDDLRPGQERTFSANSSKVTKDNKGRILAPCGCLVRTMPPDPPPAPPFPITSSNTHLIQAWLLDYYASSAFNTCTHQPLPLMTGLPPLRLLLKEGSVPHAIHTPATVPAHWTQQVRKDLEQDIDLGVLERVPSNTPTTWCSRMHVVGKKTGEPRRVVDLCRVNDCTQRQTHYTEPPFQQAMGIPPNTWRFTTDAWNGYHSVPLHPQDRHITTFLTPWGRMRYRVAPQGSVSSGDGFTFWYDSLIRHLPRKKKCIDDVAGWAQSLSELFHDTTQFLSHTSAHGVVQNPKKFNWGKEELEYVGFYILKDGVRPSDETLASIANFPRPRDITGIRSWFGLVEQVAFNFSKSKLMLPFRPLLKAKAEYVWTDDLQTAFETAKREIVELIKKGVKTFQLGLWTCLVTDWSRTGIGFVLWQKRCACKTIHPSC